MLQLHAVAGKKGEGKKWHSRVCDWESGINSIKYTIKIISTDQGQLVVIDFIVDIEIGLCVSWMKVGQLVVIDFIVDIEIGLCISWMKVLFFFVSLFLN